MMTTTDNWTHESSVREEGREEQDSYLCWHPIMILLDDKWPYPGLFGHI